MYKVIDKVPENFDTERYGKALVSLEDEYGGQSVIGVDDHCFVLFNSLKDQEFRMTAWWYKSAAKALQDFLNKNPDFEP